MFTCEANKSDMLSTVAEKVSRNFFENHGNSRWVLGTSLWPFIDDADNDCQKYNIHFCFSHVLYQVYCVLFVWFLLSLDWLLILFLRRGVGCIFYEMACGRPLFPGSTVDDELHLIFKTLGLPTEETMPGISKNEEFLAYHFPKFQPDNLINIAPR